MSRAKTVDRARLQILLSDALADMPKVQKAAKMTSPTDGEFLAVELSVIAEDPGSGCSTYAQIIVDMETGRAIIDAAAKIVAARAKEIGL